MQSSDSGQHHNHDVHGAAADRDDGAAAVTRTSSRESGAGAARGMPPALQTELGQAAENAERYKPEESVDRDLEFQPRAMPPESLDKKGFFFYLSFLCYFIFITAGLWPFTDAKHQFAKFAMDLVSVDDFSRLEELEEYEEWFDVHFLDGLIEYGIEREDSARIRVVGAPRIKQVRASKCAVDGVPQGACYTSAESQETFGGETITWSFSSAQELDESFSWSVEHGFNLYSGAGFILGNETLLGMLQAESSNEQEISEFYPFPKERRNLTKLSANGWLDDQTRALVHDFTLYSVNMDMYVTVRLLLERNQGHGSVGTSHSVSVVQLNTWSSLPGLLELLFFAWIGVLIGFEFRELAEVYMEPTAYLKEELVELRYRLYVQRLKYAAIRGVGEYNPHFVINKLSKRLFDKYPDEGDNKPSNDHIEVMNSLGVEIQTTHEMYQRMDRSGYHKNFSLQRTAEADAMRQAVASVNDTFDLVQEMHKLKCKLDTLERTRTSAWGCLSKFSPEQIRIRLPASVGGYLRDSWNVMDMCNYSAFLLTVGLRISMFKMTAPLLASIHRLSADKTEASVQNVNFQNFIRLYVVYVALTSMNSVLTWIKLFKFLDWHPQLTILLTTLAVSARPLAWFMLTFIIVLVGNAQAFFIAFQTDVPEFSTAFGSISSLMRMALGDFDYNALDTSNAVMGPILFWIYIFLVFFVLMSMFIALVSESYESVYDESKKKVYLPRGSTRSGFGTWVNAIDEAVRRVIMARDLGLISHRMRGDLDEFCEAVDENIRGKFVLEEVKRHRRTSLEGLRPQSESLQKLGEMAQTGSQDQDKQRLRAQTRKFMKDHPEHATAERLGCCGVMARCMNRASSKKLWNEDGFERRLGIAEGIESEGHPRYLAVADSTDPDEVFGGPRASWLSFRKGEIVVVVKKREAKHLEVWHGYIEGARGEVQEVHDQHRLLRQAALTRIERPLDLSSDDEDLEDLPDDFYRPRTVMIGAAGAAQAQQDPTGEGEDHSSDQGGAERVRDATVDAVDTAMSMLQRTASSETVLNQDVRRVEAVLSHNAGLRAEVESTKIEISLLKRSQEQLSCKFDTSRDVHLGVQEKMSDALPKVSDMKGELDKALSLLRAQEMASLRSANHSTKMAAQLEEHGVLLAQIKAQFVKHERSLNDDEDPSTPAVASRAGTIVTSSVVPG